eukprot:9053122-Alexandrium_andersonii.AAC.1
MAPVERPALPQQSAPPSRSEPPSAAPLPAAASGGDSETDRRLHAAAEILTVLADDSRIETVAARGPPADVRRSHFDAGFDPGEVQPHLWTHGCLDVMDRAFHNE